MNEEQHLLSRERVEEKKTLPVYPEGTLFWLFNAILSFLGVVFIIEHLAPVIFKFVE